MVSLKIKRLEDGLGRRLLDRTPRLVRLSADGGTFLGPARALIAARGGAIGSFGVARRRPIVGITDHIVGAELPVLLKRMRQRRAGEGPGSNHTSSVRSVTAPAKQCFPVIRA